MAQPDSAAPLRTKPTDRRQDASVTPGSHATSAMPSPATSPIVATPGASSSANADESRAAREAVDPDERRSRIEVEAYLRYLQRGATPGADLDDWLAAERQIDGRTE